MSADAQHLRGRLNEMDEQQRLYFFERLTNPNTFALLAAAGAFDEITPPRETEGGVAHSTWPPTAYLRNVVDSIPTKVAAIATRLETDNMRVLYDFVDLIARMPADIQEPLVDTSLAWLDKPHIEWIWSLYVDIALRLVDGGYVDASVKILRRILRVKPREGIHFPDLNYRSQDAVAEMGDVSYDHALERIVTGFPGKSSHHQLVTLLADLLNDALTIESRGSRKHDYSSIWASRSTSIP